MIGGALVAKARKLAGISQAQLGERTERNQSEISGFERSENLHTKILIELVEACGYTIDIVPLPKKARTP